MMMSILHSLYTLYASPVYSHGRRCIGLHFSLSLRDWNYNLRQILGRNYYSFQLRCSRDCFIIWGCFASHATILFSSIITSSVYLHSLRFAGLFSRRLCLGCRFYLFGSFSPRDWIYDVRQILGGLLFVPIMMFDRYWFYDLGFSFSLLPHLFSSITQSSVYLHSLRFAGRFSRRLCLGRHFLSLWFFLSERLGWGLGFRTHATLWIFSLPS